MVLKLSSFNKAKVFTGFIIVGIYLFLRRLDNGQASGETINLWFCMFPPQGSYVFLKDFLFYYNLIFRTRIEFIWLW